MASFENLTNEKLYLRFLSEAADLRNRTAEFRDALGRANKGDIVEALKGIGEVLNGVEAIKDELLARGMIKQ